MHIHFDSFGQFTFNLVYNKPTEIHSTRMHMLDATETIRYAFFSPFGFGEAKPAGKAAIPFPHQASASDKPRPCLPAALPILPDAYSARRFSAGGRQPSPICPRRPPLPAPIGPPLYSEETASSAGKDAGGSDDSAPTSQASRRQRCLYAEACGRSGHLPQQHSV